MEHYSVFKKKEILTPAAAELTFEGVVLNEISQSQKHTYCIIPAYESRNSRSLPLSGGTWEGGVSV